MREFVERHRILLLALLLHVAAFGAIALFSQLGENGLSTINIYIDYGNRLQLGQVPYRDFQLEYPPLALPLFWFPVLFSQDVGGYRLVFALVVLAFDLLGVVIGLQALKRLAPQVSPLGIVASQPLLLLAAGRSIVFERFDLVAAVLVLLAIVLAAGNRTRLGWTVLGLATALKLYPVLIAPLLILLAPRRPARRQLTINLGLFGLAILVPSVVATRGDLLSLSSFFAYHAQRGLEIETLYSSLVLSAKVLGLMGPSYVGQQFGFGASQLVAPQASFIAKLTLPLTAAVLLLVYYLAWRIRRREGEGIDYFDQLVNFSMLVILAFMLAGKVLSPQYLLWLYPLVGVMARWRGETWMWLGAAFSLSHWVYPDHWESLMAIAPLAVNVLLLRNLVLLGLMLILLAPYLPAAIPRRLAWSRADREEQLNRDAT